MGVKGLKSVWEKVAKLSAFVVLSGICTGENSFFLQGQKAMVNCILKLPIAQHARCLPSIIKK